MAGGAERFEANPEPESGKTPVPRKDILPNADVQAAKPEVVKANDAGRVDSDSLVPTPAGFTRYEKGLCRDCWFCATASVALPAEVQISEDTPLRTVYMAQHGDLLVSVSVGPALDRRASGLTDDEELRKQAEYYLANYVWLAAKPGIGRTSPSATLDGYPGRDCRFQRHAAGSGQYSWSARPDAHAMGQDCAGELQLRPRLVGGVAGAVREGNHLSEPAAIAAP